MGESLRGEFDRIDLRHRIGRLYAAVRAAGADATAWRRWRDTREHLVRSHPAGALSGLDDPPLLAHHDHDPSWALWGELTPTEPGEALWFDADDTEFVQCATVHLERHGESFELPLFRGRGHGGGLLLVFGDDSNGAVTFGGGRHLIDTAQGADLGVVDGRLRCDFNFAYHPPCAHDEQLGGPVAPSQTQLPFPVDAGERLRR